MITTSRTISTKSIIHKVLPTANPKQLGIGYDSINTPLTGKAMRESFEEDWGQVKEMCKKVIIDKFTRLEFDEPHKQDFYLLCLHITLMLQTEFAASTKVGTFSRFKVKEGAYRHALFIQGIVNFCTRYLPAGLNFSPDNAFQLSIICAHTHETGFPGFSSYTLSERAKDVLKRLKIKYDKAPDDLTNIAIKLRANQLEKFLILTQNGALLKHDFFNDEEKQIGDDPNAATLPGRHNSPSLNEFSSDYDEDKNEFSFNSTGKGNQSWLNGSGSIKSTKYSWQPIHLDELLPYFDNAPVSAQFFRRCTNLSNLKVQALELLTKTLTQLKLNPKGKERIYGLCLIITLLLQNEFAQTAESTQRILVAGTGNKLLDHPTVKYNLYLKGMVEYLGKDQINISTEQALYLCIICAHENELMSGGSLTQELLQLLKNINVTFLNITTSFIDGSLAILESPILLTPSVESQLKKIHQNLCNKNELNDFECLLNSDRDKYQINDAQHPLTNNAITMYYARKSQLNTVEKWIKAINLVLLDKETRAPLLQTLGELKDNYLKDERDYLEKTRNIYDWKVMVINKENTSAIHIEDFIQQTLITHLENEELANGTYNEMCDMLKHVSVQSQFDLLNTALSTPVEFNVHNGVFRSSISQAKSYTGELLLTNPSIMRKMVATIEENNFLNLDTTLPINLFYHTIYSKYINNKIIRCGTLHSEAAARVYLGAMIYLYNEINELHLDQESSTEEDEKLPPSNKSNGNNEITIVDNRILWTIGGESIQFQESKLFIKQKQYIESAKKFYEETNKIKINFIQLNFSNYYNPNYTEMQSSMGNLYNIFKKKHDSLTEKSPQLDFFWKLFSDNYDDTKLYDGESGSHLAFIVQYLCNAFGIAFSEGCKSNKDRGGIKKLHDEVFLAKLLLIQLTDPDKLADLTFEEFFTITPEERVALVEVAEKNTSAYITYLNTGVAGNKNIKMAAKLIKQLGLDSQDLTGIKAILDKVQT